MTLWKLEVSGAAGGSATAEDGSQNSACSENSKYRNRTTSLLTWNQRFGRGRQPLRERLPRRIAKLLPVLDVATPAKSFSLRKHDLSTFVQEGGCLSACQQNLLSEFEMSMAMLIAFSVSLAGIPSWGLYFHLWHRQVSNLQSSSL